MLKRVLMILGLAICGVINLQAMEKIPSSEPIEQTHEESEKDLTPGAFVCNGKEDKCVKDEDNQEEGSSSASLFSVFCDDHEDEIQLLACKDCQ